MLTTETVFLITTSLMLRIGVRYKHILFERMNCIHFFILCRAFATYETGEQIDSEREHIERELLDEYKEKLIVNSKNLEDPLDIKNGWVGEENGIKLWPKLYLTDIRDCRQTTFVMLNGFCPLSENPPTTRVLNGQYQNG